MTFVHYQRVWPTQLFLLLFFCSILKINAKVMYYCDVAVIKSITVQRCRIKILTITAYRYPQYRFIGNITSSQKAKVKSSRDRYSMDGLLGIVVDIMMLSECDYVVCSFVSQVCPLLA